MTKGNLVMKILFVLSLLFLNLHLVAAPIKLTLLKKAQSDNRFDLPIGSEVSLTFENKNAPLTGLFLGKMILNIDLQDEIIFLEEKTDKVLYINADQVEIPETLKLQTIVTPIDQATETCGAYALYNFWNQLRASNIKDAPLLSQSYATERARRMFLEENISNYYIENKINLIRIMKSYSKRFGFTCKKSGFKLSGNLNKYIIDQTNASRPVIVEFWLEDNADMYSSTFVHQDYESEEIYDERLWLPARIDERRSESGHMIVVAANFMYKNKRKLLILDSNWQQPRIWDADIALNNETAVADLVIHSCM